MNLSEQGPHLRLGGRTLSPSSSPYLIAEIGVNHEGSLSCAKSLIELAKEGGADAAKFQSYSADTLASRDSPAYWDTNFEPTQSQYELFKRYSTFGEDEFVALADHCHQVGIDFLSTPFDERSVDYLEPLVSAYKVASADLTNTPFLRKIGSKGKPVLLSTGASSLTEIDVALRTLADSGSAEVLLMHCILSYPTASRDAHLRMLSGLVRSYPDHLIGYSDHTLPDDLMTALLVGHLLGAVVIEKHFTHDKSLPGNDHYHAMDVTDLKKFTALVRDVHELLGPTDVKSPVSAEDVSRLQARRSIVLLKPVVAGEPLRADDLTYKRPGTGISPLHWDEVIGQVSLRDLDEDEILHWEDLASGCP